VEKLPAISLFSGAGGLDIGVERAGFDVRVCVEYERDACLTLRRNLNSEVIEHDIRDLAPDAILEAAGLRPGEAELLIGGPPCTPFSKSGNWLEYKRAGRDPNAGLLDSYLKVLDVARPRAFLLENVFGLAYANHNSTWLNHLLSSASRLGYKLASKVILAADYGVPQRRQRFFLIGALDRTPTFPEPTHSGPHERRIFDKTLPRHATAGQAIGKLGDEENPPEPEERVDGKYGHLLPAIPPGDNYLFFTAKRGHSEPLFEWRKRYWSFLLKLDPEQPAPTIQAQPGPYVGPFHWKNRRLRVLELKRLQTFPDEYDIVGTRRSRQVQLGNAVPPLLAEQIAGALVPHDLALTA
jgi:DNA (cytosine-5)-methyltransferase 1